MNTSRAQFDEDGLDEVVVSPWFHLEKLNDSDWYLRIGDKTWTLVVSKKGRVVKWVPIDE